MLNDLLNSTVEKKESAGEPSIQIGPGMELNELRLRVVNGGEVSQEELAAAIKTIREGVTKATSAQAAKAAKVPASKSKAKPAPKVSQEKAEGLLDSLF